MRRSRAAAWTKPFAAVFLVWLGALLACTFEAQKVAPRPSVLLFVMDTTRMDAVSAYGFVDGTTPAADGLAAEGLLYRNAFSSAPWTLPSHATLFTGQMPSTHGVGPLHPRARDSLVTLAERLRDAGYETYGVSENAWVSTTFNLHQGFDHFRDAGKKGALRDVKKWFKERDSDRPFFLFVNIIDSHGPYSVRDENPHLPEGIDADWARGVIQSPTFYMCDPDANPKDIEILHGLYHGDVVAADEKLGKVLDLLEGQTARPIIRIVTADHGEHFGEHGLMSHQFSLRSQLLHVPLIVHGLPGVDARVIEQAVHLGDIVPSVLKWTRSEADSTLPGRVLPTDDTSPSKRALMAEYRDPAIGIHDDQIKVARLFITVGLQMRSKCGEGDRTHGDMKSIIHWPYKLNWYAESPVELYDLTADPDEREDLASRRPDVVAELRRRLSVPVLGKSGNEPPAPEQPEVSDEVYDQLRDLGYIDGEAEADK